MPSPQSTKPTPTIPLATWELRRIVEDLGGPAAMLRKLESHQMRVPAYDTVMSWIKRGKLPATWAPTLVLLLHKERPDRAIELYINSTDGDPFS